MQMSTFTLNAMETDAVVAALRLLANKVALREIEPNDGDVGDILTGSGEHAGLNAEQIHALCDQILDKRP